MEKVTIILSGTYRQYTDWIYDNVLPDVSAIKNYRHGSSPEKVQALIAKEVIVIGTFWDEFPNPSDMYRLAMSRVRE
jgi:hypothetical protein